MVATRIVQNTLQKPGTGNPLTGKLVTFQLNVVTFQDGGTVEKLSSSYATTDETGLWSKELEVNADLEPADTYYSVREATGLIWTFVVPAGDPTVPITLKSCLVTDPVNPNPVIVTQGITSGDLTSAIDALDLGTASTHAATDFATPTSAHTDAAGQITALSLGTAATHAFGDFDPAGAAAAKYTKPGSGIPSTDLATSVQTALTSAGSAVQPAALTTALAAKADLVGGFVPTSQLPSIPTFTNHPVASQAAMLALVAPVGDVAIRTDQTNARYLLSAEPASTLGNWLLLNSDPTAGVDTINGHTGSVVLGFSDVGADASGAAATAQGNAISTASTDASTKASTAQTNAIAASAPVFQPAASYTYNSDGTVATAVENGVTTTYTYNSDGTVNTMTRAGVTRTFAYTSGVLASVA